MRIIGIDPGIKGGLTSIDTETGKCLVYRVPTMKVVRNRKDKQDYDLDALKTLLGIARPNQAYIEQVGARPFQGLSSTFFFFGKGYGIMLGMLGAFGIPITYVTPQKWKKEFGLTAEKDVARAYGSKIAPNLASKWKLKRDDGVCESFLISHYGAIQLGFDKLVYSLDI